MADGSIYLFGGSSPGAVSKFEPQGEGAGVWKTLPGIGVDLFRGAVYIAHLLPLIASAQRHAVNGEPVVQEMLQSDPNPAAVILPDEAAEIVEVQWAQSVELFGNPVIAAMPLVINTVDEDASADASMNTRRQHCQTHLSVYYNVRES